MNRLRFPFLSIPLALVAFLPPLEATEESARAAQETILALIAPRPGETVCDLGCGEGRWTFPLARAVGPHGRVFAVDISAQSLAALRKRQATEALQNIQIIHSLPDDPMLPPGQMDVVFLNDVIDHVERRALAGFLAGIRSALRPEGRLVIRDPHGGADRVIAECYRAGFALVEAKIPLAEAPRRSFTQDWYALRLRRAERLQPAILPRLEEPLHHRTRLHLVEELFRIGLLERQELRSLWETVSNAGGSADPRRQEAEDLIRAAEAAGALDASWASRLRQRIDTTQTD